MRGRPSARRRRRLKGGSAFWNARPVETPAQGVDPVLAEEGLALEDHCRHAPMSSRLQRGLIGFYVRHRIVTGDRRLHLFQVEARFRHGFSKPIALVPARLAPPDQMRDAIGEVDALAAPLGFDAEADKPVDIGLLFRDLKGLKMVCLPKSSPMNLLVSPLKMELRCPAPSLWATFS